MAAMSKAENAAEAGSRSGWLRRRPVLLFLTVTFLVSYGLGVPTLLMVGAWAPGLDNITQLYAGRLFVVIGPTCGAFVATAATAGRTEITSFLRRCLSLSARAWPFAMTLPAVALLVVFSAYAWVGQSQEALVASLRDAWSLLLVHLVLQIVIVGVGEELGWRGWLLHNLANRHGLFRATLLTGIAWYVWHFPILLGGVADAFWFALAIGGFSIVYSAMWARSGQSALLPAIAHGSVNAAVVFLTTMLPEADHRAAWNILCGMVAASGLGMLFWTRVQSLRPSEV